MLLSLQLSPDHSNPQASKEAFAITVGKSLDAILDPPVPPLRASEILYYFRSRNYKEFIDSLTFTLSSLYPKLNCNLLEIHTPNDISKTIRFNNPTQSYNLIPLTRDKINLVKGLLTNLFQRAVKAFICRANLNACVTCGPTFVSLHTKLHDGSATLQFTISPYQLDEYALTYDAVSTACKQLALPITLHETQTIEGYCNESMVYFIAATTSINTDFTFTVWVFERYKLAPANYEEAQRDVAHIPAIHNEHLLAALYGNLRQHIAQLVIDHASTYTKEPPLLSIRYAHDDYLSCDSALFRKRIFCTSDYNATIRLLELYKGKSFYALKEQLMYIFKSTETHSIIEAFDRSSTSFLLNEACSIAFSPFDNRHTIMDETMYKLLTYQN